MISLACESKLVKYLWLAIANIMVDNGQYLWLATANIMVDKGQYLQGSLCLAMDDS